MIAEVDRRLERLFAIYDDVVDAERLHDTVKLRAKLSEGLQESCLLLQDLLRLCEIATKRGPSDTAFSRGLPRLRDPDAMSRFLKTERKALDSTKLSKRTKEHAMSLLSQLIPRLLEKRVISSHEMKTLSDLARDVCRESGRRISGKRHIPLLKRAVLAATGGIVIIVNTTVTVAAPVAVYSVPTGWFVVGAAAKGQLDDWTRG